MCKIIFCLFVGAIKLFIPDISTDRDKLIRSKAEVIYTPSCFNVIEVLDSFISIQFMRKSSGDVSKSSSNILKHSRMIFFFILFIN